MFEEKGKEKKGLKKLRHGGSRGKMKPSYHCDNCGKDRFNECYCRLSKKKLKENE